MDSQQPKMPDVPPLPSVKPTAMTDSTLSMAPKSRPKHKKTWLQWVMLAVLVIVVLAVGDVLLQFRQGTLYIGVKGPKQRVVVQTVVCDNAVIAQYRSVQSPEDTTALLRVIKGHDQYQKDPTCMTILFWIAFAQQNISNATTALNTLKELQKQHLFADSSLALNSSIPGMEQTINVVLNPVRDN
jgi:hypothetical protein